MSERDDEKQAAADTVKPGTGEVGAQSATAAALEAGSQNVPAGPRGSRTELEVVDVRTGMFGVKGTGDTSGFGGLVSTVAMPPASERPYGGWFDEVVDVLLELLQEDGVDPDTAIEKVVVDRGDHDRDVEQVRERRPRATREEDGRPGRRYEMTDDGFARIEDMLPRQSRGGRWADHRTVLNGIFWVLNSGAQWRDMPERYGKCGPVRVPGPTR